MQSHYTLHLTTLALILALLFVGCGSDTNETSPTTTTPNTSPSSSSTPTCSENPTTHEEIINACTDAEKIEKNPTLPLLNSDGTLPTLP